MHQSWLRAVQTRRHRDQAFQHQPRAVETRPAEGEGRLADRVAFEDLVDPMADAWADAAEKFRAHLCYFALGKRDSSDWLNVNTSDEG